MVESLSLLLINCRLPHCHVHSQPSLNASSHQTSDILLGLKHLKNIIVINLEAECYIWTVCIITYIFNLDYLLS